MIRVRVYGPSVKNAFGGPDIIDNVASAADVRDQDGVLVIIAGPTEERPHPRLEDRTLPATRSTQFVYPRGGWRKVVITDQVE